MVTPRSRLRAGSSRPLLGEAHAVGSGRPGRADGPGPSQLEVLYISGSTDDSPLREGIDEGIDDRSVALPREPFTREVLATRGEALLDRRR